MIFIESLSVFSGISFWVRIFLVFWVISYVEGRNVNGENVYIINITLCIAGRGREKGLGRRGKRKKDKKDGGKECVVGRG